MIVLLVGLGISHDAQAAGKVDWSEYLEPPGARTPVRTAAASERSTKVSAKKQKASRSKAKKKQTAASRSKAKKTVRSKRRR